jgi:hypothetical protein
MSTISHHTISLNGFIAEADQLTDCPGQGIGQRHDRCRRVSRGDRPR